MILNRRFTNRGHTHRFIVARDEDGWEIREEEDSAVLTRVHREDWHRVERDALMFDMKARALEREGWIEHNDR